MSTIIGLFEGGTDGLLDGTLLSSGDAESNAYSFAALDTPYKLHYRAIDSVTGLDPGQDSTAVLAPSCPTGVTACFTEGGTYSATPSTDATIVVGGNRPLWLQQTDVSETAALNLTLGSLEWTTGTRVAQVGTVTPTAGVGQVALDWADVASADGYLIDYSTASDFATYTRTTSATSAKTVTGLTGGTLYYFRVYAWSELGVGAASATASATTVITIDQSVNAAVSTGANNTELSWASGPVRDTAGNLYVSYTKRYPSTTVANVMVAKSVDGGATWDEAALLASDTYGQFGSALAVAPDGTVHCVFNSKNAASGTTYYLYHATYDGSTWTVPAITAPTFSSKDFRYSSIACDSSGDVHLVTYENGGESAGYYAKCTSGTWGSFETLHDPNAAIVVRCSLAIDGSGNVHAVYNSYVSGTNTYYATYRQRTTSWQTPVNINSGTVGDAYDHLSIALDSNGYIHVTYINAVTGSTSQVWHARSTNGTTFATPITLSDEATRDMAFPTLAIDDSDNITVLWQGTHAGSTTYAQVNLRTCAGASDPTNVNNWSAVSHITSHSDASAYCPMLFGTNLVASDGLSAGYAFAYTHGTTAGSNTIRFVTSSDAAV